MSLNDALRYRARVLLNPRAHEQEAAEELEFHLGLEARRREHAARGGLTAADGRQAAGPAQRLTNRTSMKKTIVLWAMVAMASPGCALHTTAKAPSRDPNLITYEQLASNHFQSAYDAVLALHSNWLLGREAGLASNRVQVYLNSIRLGGIETLRSINLRAVIYIRRHDGLDATARWGLDHGSGVIYVSTHR